MKSKLCEFCGCAFKRYNVLVVTAEKYSTNIDCEIYCCPICNAILKAKDIETNKELTMACENSFVHQTEPTLILFKEANYD